MFIMLLNMTCGNCNLEGSPEKSQGSASEFHSVWRVVILYHTAYDISRQWTGVVVWFAGAA